MDKYDEAVAYLTEKPNQIHFAWSDPLNHPAGCLFHFAVPNPRTDANERPDGRQCGCLTMIRRKSWAGAFAWTDCLTEEIRLDTRLPDNARDISVADLPVFAEWQRRLDRELRNPPQLVEMKPERRREAVNV